VDGCGRNVLIFSKKGGSVEPPFLVLIRNIQLSQFLLLAELCRITQITLPKINGAKFVSLKKSSLSLALSKALLKDTSITYIRSLIEVS
jgi:hypothetical protein